MVNTSEFENYMGTTPIPKDFDEYWDRALKKLEETDRNISMTKADFQCSNVKCYDLYYTGVGGARIYAKYLRPENVDGKIPAVLTFHGYSDSSGDWFETGFY